MIGKIRKALFKRRMAYRAVFTPGGELGPAAHIVLSDLRKFCRATTTPAVVSPISQQTDVNASFIAIGRQEVWHRICQYIHIDDADLYKLVEDQGEIE
jgi:hypothetical protein